MMSIDVELSDDSDGLLQAVWDELAKLNTNIIGVNLIADRRDGADSSKIREGLTEHGKDFFSTDQQIADEIAEAAGAELTKRLIARVKRVNRYVKKGKKVDFISSKSDGAIAGAMLREAMKAYSRAVMARIQRGEVAGGEPPDALTPEYAAYKARKYGFIEPIGIASGQLIESLAVGGSASGKIELVRR